MFEEFVVVVLDEEEDDDEDAIGVITTGLLRCRGGGGSALAITESGDPKVLYAVSPPVDLLPEELEDVVYEHDVVDVEKDPKEAKPIPA